MIRKDTWVDAVRLTGIVGHVGSGKTEVVINLALRLAKMGRKTALADLDIVDPYFRSRERRELLGDHGVQLISSSQACVDADVPSMPPDLMKLFDNTSLHGVLDIGGDASGARVLARYRRYLERNGARIYCVVNANRPLTSTTASAIEYINSIEAVSGLHINGLINNTHLCMETTLKDVLAGAKIAAEVSIETGIPVVCHAVSESMAKQALKYVQPILPMQLYMKKPWE